MAETFPFEERHTPSSGAKFGLLVREPVGVVGAIIPWNGPISLIAVKLAPAPLAGCTVVIKASPEAPSHALIIAEIAEAVGLPPGVVNVVTADREASETLVRHPGVDKIAFTGSTATGKAIASILGARTVSHNGLKIDFGIAFGGFKQSGVGREGGVEGLRPYLETKTILLDREI